MQMSEYYQTSHGCINYHLSGQGPPVVMIMGYLARAYSWRNQVEALQDQYQVLCFDHYGIGDSQGLARTSMAHLAQDCLELMQHLGWNQAHVIGISMGGMIAQHLALQAPQAVLSLTLLVTHAGGVKALLPPIPGIPLFFKAQLARTSRQRLLYLSHLLIPAEIRKQRDSKELMEGLQQDFNPRPPKSTMRRHLWAVFRHDTRKRLAHLSCPILIVQAQKDILVHPQGSLTLHKLLPHSELYSIAEAGHGVIRQLGTGLNQRIIQHLQQNTV